MRVVPTERALAAAGAAVAVATLAVLAWVLLCRLSDDRGHALDDAFITYVYARSVAEGHGIRFNAADPEPTEGSSSLLHVAAAAVAVRAGLDPLAATRGAGVALLLTIPLALGLAVARAAAVPRGAGIVVATAVLVLWCVLPETRWHLTTGMETVAFASANFWLFAWALAATVRREPPGTGSTLLGLVLLALLVGLRPEGVALAGGTLAAVVAARCLRSPAPDLRAELRGMAPLAVAFAVVLAGFLGWKVAYFGDVLPNAYWVKAHNRIFGSSGALLPGALEVAQFLVLRWAPLAALAALALAAARAGRDALAVAVLVAPSLGVELLYARAIHEVAGGFRYGWPLLPPLVGALAYGLALAWRRAPRAVLATATATIALVPPLLTDQFAPVFRWMRSPVASATGWTGYEYDTDALAKLGLDLRDTDLGPDATIVLSGAGLVPWYSRFFAIDWVGLNTNALSGREPMTVDEVWTYIERFRPDVVYSFLPPATPGVRSRQDDPAFRSPTVRSSLAGRGSALLSHWDRERVEEMFWREMTYVRDRTVFGACYELWGDWVLLAYVRRDSPHRDALLRTLRGSGRAGCDRPDLARLYVNDPRALRDGPR